MAMNRWTLLIPFSFVTLWAATDLHVSSNGHFLEKSDGTPFFLLSSTEWALQDRSDADILTILQTRAAQGFTAVQTWGDWTNDGDPAYSGGTPPQLNTTFWQRWRWMCDRAKDRGLHFIILLGGVARKNQLTTQQAYEEGQMAASFFLDAPNVIFSQGQDCGSDNFGGPDIWRAMAEGVADKVNGVNNFDGSADYSTTMQTFHGYNISSAFHYDAWIDFYGPEVWHNPENVPSTVRNDYNLSNPTKPVFLMEGSYENEPWGGGGAGGSIITARDARKEGWYWVFSGIFGYGYGHYNNWWPSTVSNGDMSLGYLNSPGARAMTVLSNTFKAHSWWQWAPDDGLVSNNSGGKKLGVRSSTECLIYFSDNSGATIANKLGDGVSAQWIDPRDGAAQSAGSFASGQTRGMTPPGGWEDAVLVLAKPTAPSAPTIVSEPDTTCDSGSTYSYTVVAEGNPAPTLSASNLPAWLSLNAATGVLSGMPTTVGVTAPITITATNANGNDVQQFTITVNRRGPTSFYRAINCNGSAQTIDGHTFEAMSGAPNFAYFGNTLTSTTDLSPSTDAPRLAMLQSVIWIGSENTDICKFTNVPTGTYAINLYTWEDNQAPGSWQVRINGSVAGTISNSANNVWQKAGPYTVNVINGEIAIGVGTRNNCDPMISGVELWRQNGSATVSMVEGFLKYRGAATQGRLAHLFALGNGITLKSLDVYNLAGRSVLHAENDISDAALDRVNRPGYAGLILRCVDSQDRTHCRLLVGQHR
jgi:hypothetical protein